MYIKGELYCAFFRILLRAVHHFGETPVTTLVLVLETPSPLGPILGSHSVTGIDFGKKLLFLAGHVLRQTQCCPWC